MALPLSGIQNQKLLDALNWIPSIFQIPE